MVNFSVKAVLAKMIFGLGLVGLSTSLNINPSSELFLGKSCLGTQRHRHVICLRSGCLYPQAHTWLSVFPIEFLPAHGRLPTAAALKAQGSQHCMSSVSTRLQPDARDHATFEGHGSIACHVSQGREAIHAWQHESRCIRFET